MTKKSGSGRSNSGSRFDLTSAQRSGVPKTIRNEAVLEAFKDRYKPPTEFDQKVKGFHEATVELGRNFLKPYTAFARDVTESSNRMVEVYIKALTPIVQQLSKVLEGISKLPNPEQLYKTGQKYFTYSTNWEFPTDGKAPFIHPASTHRICLFESGYPACVPCSKVWCSHLDAILANSESDALLFENAFLSGNVAGATFYIPFEAGRAWLPVQVEQPNEDQPVCKVTFSIGSKGKDLEVINLGTIMLGIEGYYSIALLIQNFLDERVIGVEECKSSTHWKAKKDKQISTVVDAIGFILGRKCAICTEIAEGASGDDLIPTKEANWGARRG